jgi:hypothetical protein
VVRDVVVPPPHQDAPQPVAAAIINDDDDSAPPVKSTPEFHPGRSRAARRPQPPPPPFQIRFQQQVKGLLRVVAPLVAQPEAPAASPEPVVDAEQRIRQALSGPIHSVQNCYGRILYSEPELSGRITLSINAPASGAPAQVRVLDGGTVDNRLERCVTTAMRNLRFGLNEDITVQVPIKLVPQSS